MRPTRPPQPASLIIAMALAACSSEPTAPNAGGPQKPSLSICQFPCIKPPSDLAAARIAFVSTRDNPLGELYVMNGLGAGQIRLTADADEELSPSVTRDGTRIVFVRQEGEGGQGDIYSVNSDGSGLTALTNSGDDDFDPAWSVDGEQVAFARSPLAADQYGGLSYGTPVIEVMNRDGSGLHRVNLRISATCPTWAPDNQRLAFLAHSSEGFTTIYAVNADGTGLTNLSHPPARTWDGDPHWSPNGSKIVFQRLNYDAATLEIWLAKADGSGQTKLTSGPHDFHPRWSPDGKQISWTKGFSNGDIWGVNTDGTGAKQVTAGPDNDGSPNTNEGRELGTAEWSANGKRLVFQRVQVDGNSEIYSVAPKRWPAFAAEDAGAKRVARREIGCGRGGQGPRPRGWWATP